MSRIFICATATAFGYVLVLVGFWLGGFDFNQRGALAVTAYLYSTLVGFGFGAIAAVFTGEQK